MVEIIIPADDSKHYDLLERMPRYVRESVVSSNLKVDELLKMSIDDDQAPSGETFIEWLTVHFKVANLAVSDSCAIEFDTRALSEVTIPEYETLGDLPDLVTNVSWPGEMSDERLKEPIRVGTLPSST